MIDDLLRDTLTDDRWDLPVAPGALDRVRLAHARHRRRTAAATALGGLALVGATVAGLSLLPSHDDHLGTFAAGGDPAGSPAPGITPQWVPTHGHDWLLTSEAVDSFWAAHTRPSPGPGQSTVASPAPLGPLSEELAGEVSTAGLPVGTSIVREDSEGGQPGATALHAKLPDGRPLEILRITAQGPWDYRTGSAQVDREITVVDVPGTTSAAVLYAAGAGYVMREVSRTIAVQIVSRDGVQTTWIAPESVSMDTLRGWAFSAAQHAED